MSRIGKRPIKIEDGVSIEITPNKVVATANDKKLELAIPSILSVKEENGNIVVERSNDSKDAKSKHGLISRLITAMIDGVKNGFTKELTFTGTGYRAAVSENKLLLNMGYSHEIAIEIPADLSVVIKKNVIAVSGIDKSKVGQLAAQIREIRPPEVYKGKGIKYKDEMIKRKAGKKASSS